jgi:hypothetical protein
MLHDVLIAQKQGKLVKVRRREFKAGQSFTITWLHCKGYRAGV